MSKPNNIPPKELARLNKVMETVESTGMAMAEVMESYTVGGQRRDGGFIVALALTSVCALALDNDLETIQAMLDVADDRLRTRAKEAMTELH